MGQAKLTRWAKAYTKPDQIQGVLSKERGQQTRIGLKWFSILFLSSKVF